LKLRHGRLIVNLLDFTLQRWAEFRPVRERLSLTDPETLGPQFLDWVFDGR